MTLDECLKLHNIDIEPIFDGTFRRNDSFWFKGISLAEGGVYAIFGDWSRGIKESWKSGDVSDAEITKQLKETKDERGKYWVERSSELTKKFESFDSTGSTQYLERKKITELYGAKIIDGRFVAVPLRDAEGGTWNYQRIDEAGVKRFCPGARVKGCFHVLQGRIREARTIHLAEGYATATTVCKAMPNETVVCAFFAHNLKEVALVLYQTCPTAQIILCSDNDQWTDGNPGRTAAQSAAVAVGGIVRYPVFDDVSLDSKPTDFNDLYILTNNLDIVRGQIMAQAEEKKENTLTLKDIEAYPVVVNEKTKNPEIPSEKRIVKRILGVIGDQLCSQDGRPFFYEGTHWTEFETAHENAFKQTIQRVSGELLNYRQIENTYRHLLIYIRPVPRGKNLFQPPSHMANFQNGTLHIVGKQLEFRPHSKKDYLTNTLPFDCPDLAGGEIHTPMFDDWLIRMWDGDVDASEKIKVFKQLMGACLCPHFPTIAIFVGAPNRGKSTLVKFLVSLVDQTNTSSVQLNDMHGFNMDSMIGKLVNYCTEMETNKPINDVVVKSLIDRKPFTVQRKFKTDAVAYLPAVFLGAANDSPASLDGKSQAYGRRLIFIKTESLKLLPGTEYDFERELWEKERTGIVCKAVAGLRCLLETGGKFTVPESSVAEVRDFEERSDVLAQFIEAGENSEWEEEDSRLVKDTKKTVKFMRLFRLFQGWQEKSVASFAARLGQREFSRRLAQRGFKRDSSHPAKEIRGLAVEKIIGKPDSPDSTVG